jgi:hypothetical protein
MLEKQDLSKLVRHARCNDDVEVQYVVGCSDPHEAQHTT